MKKTLWALGLAFACATAVQSIHAQAIGERFGLGTFRHEGRTFVGIVMRFPTEPHQIGGVVVELPAAAKTARLTGIPGDLLGIIEQWESVGPQIKRIVSQVGPQLDSKRPAYVHDFKTLDALRPFLPRAGFYAGGNYRPTTPPTTPRPPAPSMPGLWEREPSDDRPQNPFAFVVPGFPTIFTGDGDPIVNWFPDQRKRYEYECELLGVVGRPMKRVPVNEVKHYMFGYTNTNDVSDRQARDPDKVSFNGALDLFAQKDWDGFKPIGPFIVPQEFVDPLNLNLKMAVSGTLVQDANTKTAWHSIYEFGSYLSNILTLPAGTVIALGTPPGSHGGLGRSLTHGDVNVCSYEGLGTLTNTVVAEGKQLTTSQ